MANVQCFSLRLIKLRPKMSFFSLPKPQFTSTTNLFSSATSIPLVASNSSSIFNKLSRFPCNCLSTVYPNTTHYEFSDGSSEVELRLQLAGRVQNPRDVFVDANENTLTIKLQQSGSFKTLMETSLYEKIKPAETIWYLDDAELVVNLKKQDPDLKWPDVVESWESLTVGVSQLLKATSIYLVGESTEINRKIAQELAVGLGYTPLTTKELLESCSKQDIDSWGESITLACHRRSQLSPWCWSSLDLENPTFEEKKKNW